MSWASRRRFIITAISAVVVIAVLALILIPTFYQSPSCTDNTQNQNEYGVDCGGPCAYLCIAQRTAPVVPLRLALVQEQNRADILAYVENPNFDAAAKSVAYNVTLYAADHTALKTGKGRVDLPAGARVPVFIPAFFTGDVVGVQGFLEIDATSLRWFASEPLQVPSVSNIRLVGAANTPRITTTLTNDRTTPYTDVKVAVVVYDGSSNVIAASQTLIPTIAAQGSSLATFTWNHPFKGVPSRIEVIPIPALPVVVRALLND